MQDANKGDHGASILLVEDDPDDIRIILKSLETSPVPVRITTVENGVDALAELDRLAVAACRRFEQLRPVSAHHLKSLSSRELEVIKWTAEGKTSHEIGRILNLSDHTINAYLANAIRKMECVNRAQLVAKAIRLKLIE